MYHRTQAGAALIQAISAGAPALRLLHISARSDIGLNLNLLDLLEQVGTG